MSYFSIGSSERDEYTAICPSNSFTTKDILVVVIAVFMFELSKFLAFALDWYIVTAKVINRAIRIISRLMVIILSTLFFIDFLNMAFSLKSCSSR